MAQFTDLPQGFEVESIPENTQVPAPKGVYTDLPEGFTAEPEMSDEEASAIDAKQPRSIGERDEQSQNALKCGEVTDLPDPKHVFEGLPEDQVEALKSAYNKHPDAQEVSSFISGGARGVMYKGQFVPAPAGDSKSAIFGGKDIGGVIDDAGSLTPGVLKGVANAGSNVIEFGLAGADKLNELEGRGKSTLAKDFRTAVPTLKGDTALQQFFVDVGEIGTGAIGGIGVASKVGSAINATKTIGQIAKAATTFIGGNAGTAVTMDANSPLLATGEDALTKKLVGYSLPALGVDKEGSYSDNLLRKRVDLVTDALATGAVAGAAGTGLGKVADLVMGATVDKIKNFVSLDLRQKNMTLDFLDTTSGIDPKAQLTADQKVGLRNKALEMLDDETRFKLESGNLDLGDIDVNRRTVHAADRAGISPEALTQAQDFEGGVRKQSRGPIDRADAQVGDVLNEGTETLLKNEGGQVIEGVPENINKARDTVQAEARAESRPFHETADTAEQMESGSKRALEEDIKQNKVIGKRATDLENAGPEALQKDFATKETNLEKINEEMKGKSKSLDDELSKKGDAIPSGLRMNNPKDIAEEAQNLLVEKHVSPELMDSIHKAQINDAAGGIDYKELIPAIKQLRKEKDRAYRAQNYETADTLQRLDDLIKKGRPDAPEIAEWDRFYKDEWAPVNRSDTSGRIRDIGKQEKRPGMGPATVKANQKAEISKSLEQPDLTKQMADVLANPKTGSGASKHLLDQTLVDDVTDEVATHIANGGVLSEISADKLSAGLKKRMAQINATNPAMGTELTTLFKRIKDGQIDIKKFGEEAKVARKAQEDADLEIFRDNFGDFFEGGGTGKAYKNTEDSLKAFDDVLKTGQSSKLKNVVNAVNRSGDEAAKRGLRAAYVRNLRQRLFDATKRQKGASKAGIATDRPALREAEIATFTEGDPLYQAGLEIFKDEPEALKFIAGLTKEASDSAKLATNSGVEQAGKDKASKAESMQGMARIITWTLGVLNPTATRAKTITSAAIDRMNPESELAQFAEYILSDAANFSKEAKKYMAKDATAIPPELKAYIRKSMVKAGVRAPMDDDKNYKETQKRNLMSR